MRSRDHSEDHSVLSVAVAARDGRLFGILLVVMSLPLVVLFSLRGDWLWGGHFAVSAIFGGLIRHEFPIRSRPGRILLLMIVVVAVALAVLGVMQVLAVVSGGGA